MTLILALDLTSDNASGCHDLRAATLRYAQAMQPKQPSNSSIIPHSPANHCYSCEVVSQNLIRSIGEMLLAFFRDQQRDLQNVLNIKFSEIRHFRPLTPPTEVTNDSQNVNNQV